MNNKKPLVTQLGLNGGACLQVTGSVTKIVEFEACHHLEGYKGDCSRMHGHSYKVEVTVGPVSSGSYAWHKHLESKAPTPGMLLDFSKLKKILKDLILSQYDHQNLDEIFPVSTAEIMATSMLVDIQRTLDTLYPKTYVVKKVRLWETSTSYCTVYGKILEVE